MCAHTHCAALRFIVLQVRDPNPNPNSNPNPNRVLQVRDPIARLESFGRELMRWGLVPLPDCNEKGKVRYTL